MYVYSEFQNEWEKWIDEKLMLLGREYLEGGTEFYSKETRRGILLRKGLGDRGEQFFHENGDLERMWYEPSLEMTPNAVSSTRIKGYDELLA